MVDVALKRIKFRTVLYKCEQGHTDKFYKRTSRFLSGSGLVGSPRLSGHQLPCLLRFFSFEPGDITMTRAELPNITILQLENKIPTPGDSSLKPSTLFSPYVCNEKKTGHQKPKPIKSTANPDQSP